MGRGEGVHGPPQLAFLTVCQLSVFMFSSVGHLGKEGTVKEEYTCRRVEEENNNENEKSESVTLSVITLFQRLSLRLSSDSELLMSRTYIRFGSWKVWRLNQLSSADCISIGSAIFPTCVSREERLWNTLGATLIKCWSFLELNLMHKLL